MNTTLFSIATLSLLVVLAGCAAPGTSTYVGPDGTTVTTNTGLTSGWCTPGAQWNAAGPQGNANYTIEGVQADGRCKANYQMNTEDGQATVEYYFDKDGKNVSMVLIGPDGTRQEFNLGTTQ
ncbi:MAG: hypothetical protein AABW99_01785 [archaeon]